MREIILILIFPCMLDNEGNCNLSVENGRAAEFSGGAGLKAALEPTAWRNRRIASDTD
jgi:hypothetical protein